jgi:hypothetical protein
MVRRVRGSADPLARAVALARSLVGARDSVVKSVASQQSHGSCKMLRRVNAPGEAGSEEMDLIEPPEADLGVSVMCSFLRSTRGSRFRLHD